MTSFIRDSLAESELVHRQLSADEVLQRQLAELGMWCERALRGGGKILFAGNGGSFADAQHLAAEFVSRLRFDRSPLPAIALATNSSAMSAIGNDYGYDQIFARELGAVASAGDVFIPISTSGNSPNILAAVEVAQQKSLCIMGLTGAGGGRMAELCPCLRVPSSRTERIQEGHILLGHILCALVEKNIFAAT